MKRRDFLRTGGAIIVSFAFDGALPNISSAQISDLGKPVDPREVDSFLAIHTDGSVTIYTSKVDVGTGLRIAMSQMVAEELDIPVDRVTVVEGDTAVTPNHGGTGGSTGIPHGRVIHPPSIGAKLMSLDESSIRAIPGARVVRIQNFLGIVAPDEWAAIRAAKELKVTWTEEQGLPGSDNLDRHVRESAPDHDETIVNKGDPAAALPGTTRQLSALYVWPIQSHASLGPSCAVADVRPEGTTIWTASQGPHGMRANFSRIFGIPEDKLRVIFLDGSGSYGGNGNDDAAADALLLSRAVGKPVRVQWAREDEHAWDPKGPPQVLEIRGGLDNDNRIAAWETHMWLPMNIQGNRPLVSVDAAGIMQPHGQGAGLMSQNGDPPYAASNVRVVVHYLKGTPLRPSNLRAPGKVANVFAVESFTDELAAAAGVDAVEFRLRGLTDPRALDVIKRAAEMIGWEGRPSPNRRPVNGNVLTGRGFAYARYKQAENYVAILMEVAVDRNTGKINVRRIACAHDGGLIVNPDGLRNQIEGSILQTLGRALHEEVKFDRSRVTSVDWASYPILSFPEVPSLDVALIDRPSLPPLGAGEASTAPVAAAVANAVFDATGIRLRRVPLRLEAPLRG